VYHQFGRHTIDKLHANPVGMGFCHYYHSYVTSLPSPPNAVVACACGPSSVPRATHWSITTRTQNLKLIVPITLSKNTIQTKDHMRFWVLFTKYKLGFISAVVHLDRAQGHHLFLLWPYSLLNHADNTITHKHKKKEKILLQYTFLFFITFIPKLHSHCWCSFYLLFKLLHFLALIFIPPIFFSLKFELTLQNLSS
jgi:hypothetical protein